MKKCKKGLHEMTEENSKLDRLGRRHCRACIRERKSGYHKGSQGIGRPSEGKFNAYRTAMDEALEADPPIIQYVRKPGGVYRLVVLYDPHADGGRNASKTQCKHGHAFTEENTIITSTGRQCRKCKNEVTSRWQKGRVPTDEQRQRKAALQRQRRQRQREEAA